MKTHIGYVKKYARPEACMAEGTWLENAYPSA